MIRVLPRDAFNDANLLKCIGKLTLLIEDGLIDLKYEYDGQPFDIQQDSSSGQTFVANIHFFLSDGTPIHHARNMNDRDPWPLWFETENDAYEVFDNNGNFIFTGIEE